MRKCGGKGDGVREWRMMVLEYGSVGERECGVRECGVRECGVRECGVRECEGVGMTE